MPLPTCRIDWRALSSVVDSADPDRDPDLVPLAHLSVKFTAGRDRFVTTSPPETVFLHPIEWKTDADGYLVSPDGQRGLYLVASDIDPENIWTWTVRISSTPTSPHQITAVSYSFVAPSGGIIDLSTVIPVPAVPARDLPAWQEAVTTTTAARDETLLARDETLDARDDAVSAANTATTAASSAVSARDLTIAARDATLAASTIVGAGRPDVAASMAAPVQALVAAATSGAEFRSLDGPQGAWVWRKRGATWVCVEGDTDWVDFSARLSPEFRAADDELCIIRRTGNRVEVRISITPSGDTVPAGRQILASHLVGFRGGPAYPPPGYYGVIFYSLDWLWNLATPLVGVERGVFSWTTSDQWPLTL